MAYMQHLGFWAYSTAEECFTTTGRKPYGVRCVDSDKSPNLETPDLRSRLVVQETRGNSSIAAVDVMSIALTFAATPPLETLRHDYGCCVLCACLLLNPTTLSF
eukprot:3972444-Amphidinium_carterae.1